MNRLLRNNKSCCSSCETEQKRVTTSGQLQVNEVSRTTYDGQEILIVPLVMAKASVVMNELLLPLDEMEDFAWNGVPVTVGHPALDGADVSASYSPEVRLAYEVGTVYNARVEGDKLKADAWINVRKAERVHPGLIEELEAQAPMDVSTGFFGDIIEKPGKLNGREYVGVHTAVLPDHLALLPGQEGACSWDDGCGVRVNKNRLVINTLTEAIMRLTTNKFFRRNDRQSSANERGEDNDVRQIVADLISADASPFVPNDEDGLRYMSEDTLQKMRDAFLGNAEEPEDNEDEPEDNEGEDPENMEDEPENNEGEDPENMEDEEKPAMNKRKPSGLQLNAEDKAALDFARRSYADHKTGLIAAITANSNFSEKQLKTFSVEQLETIKAGLPDKPAPSYLGRVPSANVGGEDDKSAEAMFHGGNGVLSVFQNKKQKAA